MKIHPLKLQFEFELSQPKEINSSSNRNINLNSQTLLKASNKSLNQLRQMQQILQQIFIIQKKVLEKIQEIIK